MPDNLYAVFSKPPDGVSWEEYDRWYGHHAVENVQSRAFNGVQRYAVNPVVIGSGVGPARSSVDPAAVPYNHLAVFEFRGDIADVRGDLARRVQGGEIVLPNWFDGVPFASWNCVPLGDRIVPKR
jgi:hypothetical protein